MPVKVKYSGGPRHGKKGTLRDVDHPPEFLRFPAEAKKQGLAPGQYHLAGHTMSSTDVHADYVWRGNK